jgi:predicted metalloprotease
MGGRRSSENFEDRRGMSSGGKTIVGGGIIGIIILLLNTFGENVQMLTLFWNNESRKQSLNKRALTTTEIEEGKFIETILVDTEDVWEKYFRKQYAYKKN